MARHDFTGGAITIPGDISSAAYFVAAAMLLTESELTIEGVGLNPTRAAFLSVLEFMGRRHLNYGSARQNATNHTEQSTCVAAFRKIASEDERTLSRSMIPSLIDELPLLAVVGSQISGGIRIQDAGELTIERE